MRKNRRQADPMGVLKRPDKRSSLATGNSNIPEGFHTINFDSEKYLESYFSDNSVLTAAQHRKLLAKSKLNIAGTLKKIAYDYYDKFVDTADSMQCIFTLHSCALSIVDRSRLRHVKHLQDSC